MTQYFIKLPSNFFRIPESRYFRRNAASEVYEFLVDMAYRSEEPFFGNKSHMPSKMMADAWKNGKLTCFATVSLIEKYRGMSKNTVKEALRTLIKLELISVDGLEKDAEPYSPEGMLYIVGIRIRHLVTDKLTKQSKTNLERMGEIADTPEGALRVQRHLIRHLCPTALPMPILNIRFEDVDTQVVRKTKKVRQERKIRRDLSI